MPVVELNLDGRSVHAPAWIMPGHADGSITIQFGYGREFAGRVGGQAAMQRVGLQRVLAADSSHSHGSFRTYA